MTVVFFRFILLSGLSGPSIFVGVKYPSNMLTQDSWEDYDCVSLLDLQLV